METMFYWMLLVLFGSWIGVACMGVLNQRQARATRQFAERLDVQSQDLVQVAGDITDAYRVLREYHEEVVRKGELQDDPHGSDV